MRVPAERPLPHPSEELGPFWEGLRRGEFLLPRCERCGAWRWPPAGCREHPNDPYLANLKWTPASGRGKVFAYTVQRVPFHPAFSVPYVYALIELNEGPVMVSNVIDCDPEDVSVGMPVLVRFVDIGDATLPLFGPEGAGRS